MCTNLLSTSELALQKIVYHYYQMPHYHHYHSPDEVKEEALEMELLMLGVGLLLLSSAEEGRGVEKGRFKATKCS